MKGRKPPAKPVPYVMTLRLEPDLYRNLEKYAEHTGRTKTSVIRMALRAWLPEPES